MKLYLHNFLMENKNGSNGYPLHIISTETRHVKTEYNPETCAKIVSRIDFIALAGACNDLGIPFTPPEDVNNLEEGVIQSLHHILFEVEVVEGYLVSPSGNHYRITRGIPDMTTVVEPPHKDDDE